MPTIEIASIQTSGLHLNQSDFGVAILEENELKSHRGLFYDILLKQKGVIVHIGNPDLKDDKGGAFYAGQTIDWDFEPGEVIIPEVDTSDPTDNWGQNQQFRFRFLEQYKTDIDKILRIALDASPIKKVFFLSDYQFGPHKANIEIIYTISDFWTLHDTEGLRFNTLYELYGQ